MKEAIAAGTNRQAATLSLGILAEVVLGAPPFFVLVGGLSMTLSVAWLGLAAARLGNLPEPAFEEGK